MIQNDKTKMSVWAVLCWAGLLALLLGLFLADSPSAQAGATAAGNDGGQAALPADETVTHTLFLPLLARHHPCFALSGVQIDTPAPASVGVALTLEGTVLPGEASQPIDYTWRASGQAPVVHQGGLSDSATFTWDVAASQAITLEATNACGHLVSDTLHLETAYRNYIAFERDMPSDKHDIFIMYQDGTRMENVTNSPDVDDGAPTWSPDGNSIAFSATPEGGNPRILKIDLRSRAVTSLTGGSDKDRWPNWSPDGTRIAFERKTTTSPKQIYVMNADGSNQQNLTNSEFSDESPAWSWDGEWVAFISERFWGGRDLWIVDPDNPGDQRNVQRTDSQEELYPSWSPGGLIYYTFSPTDAKEEQLYRIGSDGSGRTKVFADSYKRYIASFAPDGTCFVFYGYMGGGDKEVWKWCNGFGAPINLTNNQGISDEFCAWSPVP